MFDHASVIAHLLRGKAVSCQKNGLELALHSVQISFLAILRDGSHICTIIFIFFYLERKETQTF